MGQGDSARDFDTSESMENAGILDVFPIFHTARLGQKIRRSPLSPLCGVAIGIWKEEAENSAPSFFLSFWPDGLVVVDIGAGGTLAQDLPLGDFADKHHVAAQVNYVLNLTPADPSEPCCDGPHYVKILFVETDDLSTRGRVDKARTKGNPQNAQ